MTKPWVDVLNGTGCARECPLETLAAAHRLFAEEGRGHPLIEAGLTGIEAAAHVVLAALRHRRPYECTSSNEVLHQALGAARGSVIAARAALWADTD